MSLPYEFTAEEIIGQGRTKPEYIEAIKTWLPKSGSDFIPKTLCDELIVLFLLSCNNNIENTKTTVKAHYRCKTEVPEIFDNRNVDSDELKSVLNTWICSTFPYRTNRNSAIIYFQLVDGEVNKMDNIGFIKAFLMLLDVILKMNPPETFIAIIDLEKCGLRHLPKFKFDASRKLISYVTQGLPLKLEAVHILNSKYFVIKLFELFKAWIKNEVIAKVHFHLQNMPLTELYEIVVSKEGLPAEFGGYLPSLKNLHLLTRKQFKDTQKFWDAEEKMRKDCPYYKKNNC